MKVIRLIALVSLFSLSACSSFMRSIRGDEEPSATSNRAPASNGSALTLNNGGDPANARLTGQPDTVGPHLSANEFSPQTRMFDDRAGRGYRRQSDPWEGTGPANEGSLWNADGQDNFYFSRNTRKKLGDIVLVKLEPDVIDAMNSKINTLLTRSLPRQMVADEAGKKAGDKVADKIASATGSNGLGRAVGDAASNRVVAAIDKKENHIDIEEIPVRLVETLPRSSFRVEGSRRVNVRGAPYLLKISGVVRDEDLGGTGVVATSKVFDSKMELTR